GLRGPRELPRAADDRRARHGIPAPERALLLALPARRDRPLCELVLGRRRRARRLVLLPAPFGPRLRARQRTGPLDPRHPPDLDLVDPRGDQLHRDDPQHARARDELDAHAALRLVDLRVRDPDPDRADGTRGRPDAAAPRPPRRTGLLL